MNIPNFIDEQFVNKEGHLTEPWRHVLQQLFYELQTKMSDESHIAPSQTTANITQLNVTDYAGGLVYDTDAKVLKANIDGTFKTVTTS